jgi:hypothetical protein
VWRTLLLQAGCIIAVAIGAMASLAMFAGSIAGAANLDPKKLRGLKAIMWATLLGGATAAIGGVYLMAHGHPGYGALLGGAPAISLIVILICLSVR